MPSLLWKFEIYTNQKILKYLLTQQNLNFKQSRWINYMEDCDFALQYHSSKVNVLVDALSRNPHDMLACQALEDWKRMLTIGDYNLQYYENDYTIYIYNIVVTPILLQQVQ